MLGITGAELPHENNIQGEYYIMDKWHKVVFFAYSSIEKNILSMIDFMI